MKIFFITSKLNFKTSGGSIEEIDLMMKTLQKLGNEVTAVTAFSNSNDIAEPLPYRVIEENIGARGLLGIQWGLFKILRKYSREADIFQIDGHIFLYGAGLYRLLGGKVPIIAYFNYYLMCWPDTAPSIFSKTKDNLLTALKKKIRWYLEKYIGMPIANQINAFTFVSPTLKAVYEDFGLRKDQNAFVVGDLIDFSKIMKENGISEDSYLKRNKKQGPFTIFYSSRMAPGKGFDLLLDGFAKVKNKENFRLILGGSGPEEGLVRQMIKDLGLEKYVYLPGWVSKGDLYKFYKEADIFIQVGWKPEGTSISLLYAMAFGVPSILPGGGGLEWQAQGSALYVKNGDADDLAAKIEKLAGDYNLRAELSKNCYKRIKEDPLNYQKQVFKLNLLLSRIRVLNKYPRFFKK